MHIWRAILDVGALKLRARRIDAIGHNRHAAVEFVTGGQRHARVAQRPHSRLAASTDPALHVQRLQG